MRRLGGSPHGRAFWGLRSANGSGDKAIVVALRWMMLPLVVWAAACLPNPQSVKERRESFDRQPLRGSLVLGQLPADARKVGSVFGDRIELAAFDLRPAQPKPGDRLDIRFYWRALKPINEDYQVFVHGDSMGGYARRIHADHYPAKGKYPTDVWRPDEYIVDPFSMSVPGDYGGNRLGIYTGMYKDNYRVPLTKKGGVGSDTENRSRPIEIPIK